MSPKHYALGVDLGAELRRMLNTPALKPYKCPGGVKFKLRSRGDGVGSHVSAVPGYVTLTLRKRTKLDETLGMLLWGAVIAVAPHDGFVAPKFGKAAEELWGCEPLPAGANRLAAYSRRAPRSPTTWTTLRASSPRV